jgi:hexosaminidase
VTGHCTAPPCLCLIAESGRRLPASEAFRALVEALFPVEGIVRPAAEGGHPIALSIGEGYGLEGYAISFGQDGAALTAATRTGLLYGLITLGQILRGSRKHPGTFAFPDAGEIRDEPALGWRGTHLDVARQFYSSAEVTRFLHILAWNKLNRFHWHLSDDEGWRVEIDAYPELVRIGAWRGQDLAIPALLGSGAAPYGGYYGKAAIRAIVALAKKTRHRSGAGDRHAGSCLRSVAGAAVAARPRRAGRVFFRAGLSQQLLEPGARRNISIRRDRAG